jgi:lipoate-protein ligase A
VEKGLITAIKFYGDFFAQKDPAGFEGLFLQQKYEPENIRRILESVEINDYFRNVTEEEMLALFF